MKRDERCSFAGGQLRCPLPATWWPENGAHGYCRMHDDADKRKMEPWEAEAQLARMRDNAKQYAQDLLEGGWSDEIERRIQQRIDEHPEWQRQDDESSRDYAKRMMAECKRLGSRLRGQQHVG